MSDIINQVEQEKAENPGVLSSYQKFRVNWSYVYYFNVFFIIIVSISALGFALAALLTQPTTNAEVKTLKLSGPLSVNAVECGTVYLLQLALPDMHINLPDPNSTSGCTFSFVYVGGPPGVTPEISLTTATGQIIGLSFIDPSLQSSHSITSRSVSLAAVANAAFSVTSDGSNYRMLTPGVGVSNLS